MTEALVAASPRMRRGAAQARPPALGPAIVLSEARRAWNREHVGRVAELRCECAEPSCNDWLPAVADAHRGPASCFVVKPTHFNSAVADSGVVVKAADQFFVVEIRQRP